MGQRYIVVHDAQYATVKRCEFGFGGNRVGLDAPDELLKYPLHPLTSEIITFKGGRNRNGAFNP
jgi:hypothetical protein